MTDKTQPEALRLAEMLTADEWPGSVTLVSYARECVAELRRQHARIAELEAARFAYASEFEPNGDGDPDVGSIHANIRAMKAKLASIDAGGVALSAAPAGFLNGVIALCTNRGSSPENIEAWDKDDKWIADLWRQAEAMLAGFTLTGHATKTGNGARVIEREIDAAIAAQGGK